MSTRSLVTAATWLAAMVLSQPTSAQYQPQYQPYTVGSGTSTAPREMASTQQQLAATSARLPAPASPQTGLLVGNYQGDLQSWDVGIHITGIGPGGVPYGMERGSFHYRVFLSTPKAPAPFEGGIGADGLPFINFPAPSKSYVTGLHMGGPSGSHLCGKYHRVDSSRMNAGMDAEKGTPFCMQRM